MFTQRQGITEECERETRWEDTQGQCLRTGKEPDNADNKPQNQTVVGTNTHVRLHVHRLDSTTPRMSQAIYLRKTA